MELLDPIRMYLLRQHEVIEASALRAIANEKGVRITNRERATLLVSVLAMILVAGLFTRSLIVGDFAGGPFARTTSVVWFAIVPWIFWTQMRSARRDKVTAAMLKHRRCPHCGYDLRLLQTDVADGATVCPECGCAWRLADNSPTSRAPSEGRPA